MKAYRKFFKHGIRRAFPGEQQQILQNVDKQYQTIALDITFALTSSNPLDKRLDFSAYFLSLIIVLDRRGNSFEEIRKICLDIVTDYVTPRSRLQLWMQRIPPALVGLPFLRPALKNFGRRLNVITHPLGFKAEIITDKGQTFGLGYGFDILECGICKLFQRHHYGRYASILCEVDRITSATAGLMLIRSGTIANGSPVCDFRFRRATSTGV